MEERGVHLCVLHECRKHEVHVWFCVKREWEDHPTYLKGPMILSVIFIDFLAVFPATATHGHARNQVVGRIRLRQPGFVLFANQSKCPHQAPIGFTVPTR